MKRLVLLLTMFLSLSAPVAVYAYNPVGSACDSGATAQSSSACNANPSGGDTITGPNGVLRKASTIIAVIAGAAAVIIMIVGGFQYITSAGDPQKATNARNAILGAVIGLVIIAAAESIVIFVLTKL